MSDIPHDLPYDSRLARMRKRLQGLQRVAAAINDLYIYGVYPSIALFDDPMDQYDLTENDKLEVIKDDTN